MSQFRFANVEWIHALWLVGTLAFVLIALELRGVRALERMLSPLMQVRLVNRPTLGRRVVAVLLLCGALTSMIVALMRPQWGSTVQLQTRVDSQIMICLDVSRSMLAEDVVPNRLERAKAEIDSLLSLMRDGQQVGLMAFAGKASVLCPLTTDFGFLRLILAEANPATVGLGGTRVGEAITKAVDGFREVGDVNRLILLITDGEDHDSFPLDAAKAAKEKGVRIVSIGFGDELGSKIVVTDPRTGARITVEDRDGTPVISRLDGETLREIALETEGAYIPAGTGALDWQSIYQAHIAGFLRGTTTEEETVVRNEAYQWCVLVALVLLLVALATPTLFAKESAVNHQGLAKSIGSSRAASWLGWGLLFISCAEVSHAQTPGTALKNAGPAPEAPNSAVESSQLDMKLDTLPNNSDDSNQERDQTGDLEEESSNPRELYNRAVALVSTDLDRAERLLNASRREAGVDGELRYRGLYNLGWVEVNRAEGLLEQEPEQALIHLEMAAGRFREAIRVRPESDDARHNLEIISRRILELSDSLAQKEPQEFAPRLDELIVRIREHQSELQRICSLVAASQAELEKFRNEFRQLGVAERQIISDLEKLAAEARRQITADQAATNQQKSQGAQTPVQTAQLAAMLGFLDSAVQRMHKARSFVRRLQSERAFVRWVAGLTDTKRARDQLRDPLDILGVLVADATEHMNLTQIMNLANLPVTDADSPVVKPSWLSDEVLSDGQLATTERTAELHDLLSSAVTQSRQPQAADPQAGPTTNQETQELIANIEIALPAIGRAKNHFSKASEGIASQSWSETLVEQSSGINELLKAAEVFFDVRRLIDAALQDQRGIASAFEQLGLTVAPLSAENKSAENKVGEALSNETWESAQTAIAAVQQKNLQRAERLATMFLQELEKLETAADAAQESTSSIVPDSAGNNSTTGSSTETDQASQAAQRERFELAEQLRAVAEQSMREVVDALAADQVVHREDDDASELEIERPPAPRRAERGSSNEGTVESTAEREFVTAGNRAVTALEELQRLFFSVVEHLRETAQRQAELNDGTTQMLAQPDQQTPSRIGPLQHRQLAVEKTAQAIAEALEQQASGLASAAESEANPVSNGADQPQTSPSAEEKLSQAAGLVREGVQAMGAAAQTLAAAASLEEPDVDLSVADNDSTPQGNSATEGDARPAETGEMLESAAADQQTAWQKLLDALQLLVPPQSQNQNQQQQQQQQPQDKSDEKTESQPQNMDAEQMLQAIREREANRRRERQPQGAASAGGVEKDW